MYTGPKSCIGERFAQLELKYAITALLLRRVSCWKLALTAHSV